MILGCLDLYFWCLDLSLRSAKGVNNCQVSPSAHMQTAKGLLLMESSLILMHAKCRYDHDTISNSCFWIPNTHTHTFRDSRIFVCQIPIQDMTRGTCRNDADDDGEATKTIPRSHQQANTHMSPEVLGEEPPANALAACPGRPPPRPIVGCCCVGVGRPPRLARTMYESCTNVGLNSQMGFKIVKKC